MQIKIKEFIQSPKAKQALELGNISLYIFALIVVAITWSGIKAVQSNYDLQKQISEIKQQNAVLELRNKNISLKNEYLQTDEYLDMAARQSLGKAAPGEKVVLIPKEVALKYLDQKALAETPTQKTIDQPEEQSKIVQNVQDWRDFLLGRRLIER